MPLGKNDIIMESLDELGIKAVALTQNKVVILNYEQLHFFYAGHTSKSPYVD